MAKKSKGRQKIKMAKMENESNLQVTFSKRKNGLFKKASEISTLCDAEVVVILFSPGGKVFSFGHPNVNTILDRFLNINPPPPNPNTGLQLDEVRRNSTIRKLNNDLTQLMNELESEGKKAEDLKKVRETSKRPLKYWEEPVQELDIGQAKEYKDYLENLKKTIEFKASKICQANLPQHFVYVGSSSNAPVMVDGGNPHQNFHVGSSSSAPPRADGGNPQQNFYVGSSSSAPPRADGGNPQQNFYVGSFSNAPRVDGGTNINPHVDQFGQPRMFNMNAFYNQNPNMFLPNQPLRLFGNINPAGGFVPGYNPNYRPDFNQNQNVSLKEENTSEAEPRHDGNPPQS